MKKKFQKFITIAFIISLLAALCACGKSNDSQALKNALNGQKDALSSVEDSDTAQDANTSDKEETASEKTADLPENFDSAEADYLLNVTFFADKREAEAAADAAGGKLLSSYDSEVSGDGSYNPMSWCYALITAIHDDTEVTISRGYDGSARGNEASGFITTDVEHYELMDAGEKLVIEVNVEWYPVFQIEAFNDEYMASIPLGWDIYTSKDDKGIPAPLKITGQKLVEGNGSYFVRIGKDVYFHTYEKDTYSEYVLDGDFLSCIRGKDDNTVTFCRYDEETGRATELSKDGGTGKLYYCGGRFYCDHDSDVTVITITPDGIADKFCPGNVAGISEDGKYITLWTYDGDDRFLQVIDEDANSLYALSADLYLQLSFCGVANGNLFFLATDANEVQGIYSVNLSSPYNEPVFLGEVPSENIFTDIRCDKLIPQGENVYLVMGYYGGPVYSLESYIYVEVKPEEEGSLEILEQGEKSEAFYNESVYLTHSIFGSPNQRKFLYGDLLYKDDDMQEKTLIKNFIPFMDREHLILQTGEILGGSAYICVAETTRNEDEDYKIFAAYDYVDMYYLRIPLDGSGDIESIYKASWDDALDFNEDNFAPYIGKWQMTKESYGENEASPADRKATAVIKDNLTLTISDEEADKDAIYELSNLLDDDAHTSIWYDDISGNIITGELSGGTMILDIPVELESLDDPRPASRKAYFEK